MTQLSELDRLDPRKKRELLARLLREREQDGRASFPLSYGQLALWFLHELAPASPAYNVVWAGRLRSAVDSSRLQVAVGRLLEIHPMLRSHVERGDGAPGQRIGPAHPEWFREVDASGLSETALHLAVSEESQRPFDLVSGPAFRASLFTRAADDRVLVFVVHHAVFDAWSAGLVLRDLARLCRWSDPAASVEAGASGATYADFVRWQRRLVESSEGEALWAYWQRRLDGAGGVLDLPTDHPRPAAKTFRGGTHEFTIGATLSGQVRQLARAEGTTPFVVLVAGFQLLLHRWTGQADVLIGCPLAGRTRPEFERVVGYFVNSIVLRSRLDTTGSVRDFIAAAREQVVEGLRHGDFPFSEVVRRIQPGRDPSRSPLFQVMFNFVKGDVIAAGEEEPTTGELRRLGDLLVEPFPVTQQEGQFDLDLTVLDAGDEMPATLKFDAALFERTTAEEIAHHFVELLGRIVAAPGQRAADGPLLTDTDRRRARERSAADRQANLRGHRIELSEVEDVLRRHPAVADTVVAAVEAEVNDPRLIAYVVPRHGAALGEEDLRAHAARALPEHLVPAHVVLLAAFPLTAEGRADRRLLVERGLSLLAGMLCEGRTVARLAEAVEPIPASPSRAAAAPDGEREEIEL